MVRLSSNVLLGFHQSCEHIVDVLSPTTRWTREGGRVESCEFIRTSAIPNTNILDLDFCKVFEDRLRTA